MLSAHKKAITRLQPYTAQLHHILPNQTPHPSTHPLNPPLPPVPLQGYGSMVPVFWTGVAFWLLFALAPFKRLLGLVRHVRNTSTGGLSYQETLAGGRRGGVDDAYSPQVSVGGGSVCVCWLVGWLNGGFSSVPMRQKRGWRGCAAPAPVLLTRMGAPTTSTITQLPISPAIHTAAVISSCCHP